jgi:hypothetical protein
MTYWAVYTSAYEQAKATLGLTPSEAREFAKNLAKTIADANMHADGWNEHAPIWKPDNNNPTPHWQTTGQAITQVEDATTPEEFGFALHGYQDSFSHWQELGSLGYSVDTAQEIWSAHADCLGTGSCQVDEWDGTNDNDLEMYGGMLQLIDEYVTDYISEIEEQEEDVE